MFPFEGHTQQGSLKRDEAKLKSEVLSRTGLQCTTEGALFTTKYAQITSLVIPLGGWGPTQYKMQTRWFWAQTYKRGSLPTLQISQAQDYGPGLWMGCGKWKLGSETVWIP